MSKDKESTREFNMSGFLKKFQKQKTPSRSPVAAKEKLQFRDEADPRIVYKISQRAKRISLRVKASDREVTVIVPGQRSITKARKFVGEQRDWINVQLETLPEAQPFIPGASILLRGELYQLLNPKGRGRPTIYPDRKVIHVPSMDTESFSGRVRRFLIREAREELETVTLHYADKLGKRIGKVSIRDTSSRWGSCITRKGEGHISYSWRLISAPEHVLEYVVAHECAHLVHADHSANFWSVCEDLYPDMNAAKRWLKTNGPLLHAVGADY